MEEPTFCQFGACRYVVSDSDLRMRFIRRLLHETEAATAVEYAVVLALILAVIIASIAIVGTATQSSFQSSGTKMSNVGIK